MNLRHLKAAMLLAGVAAVLFGTVRTASASPSMVVTCSAPTGLNIASDIEPDQPKGSVPEVYDPEAKAFVSHPRKTQSAIITVNKDGTASQTSFSDDGTSLVTDMRIVGTINSNAITLIDGGNGFVDLLTLYPKESIAIFAGTSYFGWHKSIPTGYAYISHCKFSNVIN
jgi:hypothetical protein